MKPLSAFICGPSAFICVPRLCVRLVVLLALALPPIAQAQGHVKDDLGREVAVVGAVARVVTLAPFLTEDVAAAGGLGQLVAVSEHSDFPPYARSLPTVSSSNGIHWEKLLAARPDLVFAWKDSLRPGDVERLEQAKIKVFVVAGRRLADVPRIVRAIAAITGRNPPPVILDFEQRLEELRVANAGKAAVTVFLEVAQKPLRTIAGEHFMNDALATCGARNVFQDLPGVAPEVAWESVMARDPQAIVGAGNPANEEAFRIRWKERATLRAVKADALIYVNGDLLFRQTPRIVDGIAALCRGIETVRSR